MNAIFILAFAATVILQVLWILLFDRDACSRYCIVYPQSCKKCVLHQDPLAPLDYLTLETIDYNMFINFWKNHILRHAAILSVFLKVLSMILIHAERKEIVTGRLDNLHFL